MSRTFILPRKCDLLLIGCGAEKGTERCQAQQLYTSQFFAAKRAFANSIGIRWAILSAKYGILHADRVIPPYNKRVDELTMWQKRQWAIRTAAQLLDWDRFVSQIAIVAGDAYMHPLTEILAAIGVEVVNPCQGLGIGKQIAWLRANTHGLDRSAA